MDIKQVLKQFPKVRPPLPVEQQRIYEGEYLANREGEDVASSLAQKLESWMHKKVAEHTFGNKILEIGAGTLNHLPYVEHTEPVYDVIEPQAFLYEGSTHKAKVRSFFADIKDVNEAYDTICSIAALEHIANLPDVIAKSGTLLSPDGIFVNSIPCEGGLLWGLGWRCTTGLSYKLRTGYSYKHLMRHEHVNNHDEIIALNRYFFESVDVYYFPLYGKHLSFYACVVASRPILSRCEAYT